MRSRCPHAVEVLGVQWWGGQRIRCVFTPHRCSQVGALVCSRHSRCRYPRRLDLGVAVFSAVTCNKRTKRGLLAAESIVLHGWTILWLLSGQLIVSRTKVAPSCKFLTGLWRRAVSSDAARQGTLCRSRHLILTTLGSRELTFGQILLRLLNKLIFGCRLDFFRRQLASANIRLTWSH